MTVGIYRLCFKNTTKVYIGQSINIEKRFKEHLSKIKLGKANTKLLEANNLYGMPTCEILCECTVEELDKIENEAIEIFDAVNNGFNILERAEDIPSPDNSGEKSGSSKYTNLQIIEVFKLLLDASKSLKEIGVLTGVPYSSILKISNSSSHKWLEERFPEDYKILRDLKGSRNDANNRGKSYPAIKNPAGEIFSIKCVSKFAKEYGLHQGHLGDLLKGRAKTHKGWSLA